MTIMLATCADLPQLDTDDQALYRALQKANLPVEIAIWDDPSVDWSKASLCVIRSTWDYVPKRERYVQWAEQVASQTILWNPAPLIRWNTDKTYLREMAQQGVPIVETVWLTQGSAFDLKALLEERNWTEAVIKPVISASGKDTFRVSRSTASEFEPQVRELLSQRELMVQPFMVSVATVGELSFLYFNGEFSHAVAKRPSSGEFRVQEHLGGKFHPFVPSAEQLASADAVMRRIPHPTLYARVDMMADEQGGLRLSELELTEPSMYLAYDAAATGRFVQAIRQRLQEISV
jgi:glutathione synthase/RimK-type ligase-like ATP-grasp enzyme